MAKQTFSVGQVLTAAQMTSLQQTAMLGGSTTAKTTSYTLVAADAGTVVSVNSTSATTITVNTGLFSAGDTVTIQNWGSGAVTITNGTATVNTAGSLIVPQYDGGVLYFTSASAAIYFDWVQAGATSPLTTKGDIWGYGTSDARIPIGTNGDVLTADSTQTLGLKWSAPAGGGGMTLINTGGTDLSGVSGVTISSIPTTYKHLCIVVKNVVLTTGTDALYFRPNNDSNTNYSYQNIRAEHSTYTGAAGYTVTGEVDFAYPLSTNTATKKKCNGVCWMYRYNDTDSVFFDWSFWNFNNNANVPQGTAGTGYWTGGGGVTSLRFVTGGTFSAGTVYVYGVN